MKKLRAALIIILAAVFAVSAFMFGRSLWQSHANERAVADAIELAGLNFDASAEPSIEPSIEPSAEPSDEPSGSDSPSAEPSYEPDEPLSVEQRLQNLNLDALRGENDEVIGWLYIPGAEISFPLLQGTDNQYYLSHNWRGESNAAGAVFMDYRSNDDLGDFNTIIYGHRMRDGSMFTPLLNYSGEKYFFEHQYIYIAAAGGVYKYRAFAAWEAGLEDTPYDFVFASDAEKQALIDQSVERSAVSAAPAPTVEDRILTLSTCMPLGRGYSTRWVVQAVLVEVTADGDGSAAVEN